MEYKRVEILGVEVEIPDPFPVQEITGEPRPLNPPIIIGDKKLVGVRVSGILPDLEIQWGALSIKDEKPVWEGDDPIVQELHRQGYLVPSGICGLRKDIQRGTVSCPSWRWPGSE